MANTVSGYEGLARFMGTYPELAIFRRFGALNLQNIIYLQAEITTLEDEFQEIVAEDNLNAEREMFSRDWDHLANSANSGYGDEAASRRYRMIIHIRQVLKDYSM
jgi:hypothetical protein